MRLPKIDNYKSDFIEADEDPYTRISKTITQDLGPGSTTHSRPPCKVNCSVIPVAQNSLEPRECPMSKRQSEPLPELSLASELAPSRGITCTQTAHDILRDSIRHRTSSDLSITTT
ncbi:hypothetical protein AG1IA_03510 [Rhizoctonia solani AG-1 IA]|uniref:Uncharacterized protein n=1 Tax=Thanatephorus cucumeris (strain AG1-IA) TaxID=983506 RepID=L8WWW3_THACA|nr:hypothetical protein AG1IA_03510 [Rhizoctonia solani AG-1 IA]